jgi:hypothetical protein
MDKIPNFQEFASCALETATTRARQCVAFLYYRSKYMGGNVTLSELKEDFNTTGLGKLDGAFVRTVFKKDPRVRRVSKDKWLIPSDRFILIETELDLSKCSPKTNATVQAKVERDKKQIKDAFIDEIRIQQLNVIQNSNYDLSRLIKMCHEINDNAANNNWISTILLVRAVLDHVPPIFGFVTFIEVANNFSATKSVKISLQHLQNSSRTIADSHLHTPIRKKETLPTKTQVNFSNDLDVLLAEIVRIL